MESSLVNPAQLSPSLQNLFPSGVVAVELLSEAPRAVLTEDELSAISHCAAKRIDDFSRGRACAHRALEELGIPGFSLLAGDKREPLWPAGIVGSLTHTTGFAAAVVASRGAVEAVGIDCEVIASVDSDLWERICTPAERAGLERLPQAQAQRQAALIFAAKESFYKCQFPLSRAWVGFEDVTIDVATGVFRIVPEVSLPIGDGWVASLQGRYEFRDPWVITGVSALVCAPV